MIIMMAAAVVRGGYGGQGLLAASEGQNGMGTGEEGNPGARNQAEGKNVTKNQPKRVLVFSRVVRSVGVPFGAACTRRVARSSGGQSGGSEVGEEKYLSSRSFFFRCRFSKSSARPASEGKKLDENQRCVLFYPALISFFPRRLCFSWSGRFIPETLGFSNAQPLLLLPRVSSSLPSAFYLQLGSGERRSE